MCGSVCGAGLILCAFLRRLFVRCSGVRPDSNLGKVLCMSICGIYLCVVIDGDVCRSDMLAGGWIKPTTNL